MSIDNEASSDKDLGLDGSEQENGPDKYAEYKEARNQRVAEGQAVLNVAIEKIQGLSEVQRKKWAEQADGKPVQVDGFRERRAQSVTVTMDNSDLEVEIMRTENGIVAFVNPEIDEEEAAKAFDEGKWVYGRPEYNMIFKESSDVVTLEPGTLVYRAQEPTRFQRLLTRVEAPISRSDYGEAGINLPDLSRIDFPAHKVQTIEEWDQEGIDTISKTVVEAKAYEIAEAARKRREQRGEDA